MPYAPKYNVVSKRRRVNYRAAGSIRQVDSCPKCKALVVPADSFERGKRVDSWRCSKCGLTGESESWFNAQTGETVMMV